MTELQKAVAAYCKAGYAIFPVLPKGKKPLIKGGVHAASKNPKQILEWWRKWPDANIGLPMGKINGIFGLDGDYDDGLLEEVAKKIPRTIIARSPTHGYKNFHAYFNLPPSGIRNGFRLGRGLTIRSEGYYFVAPPSVHPDGGIYKFDDNLGLLFEDPASCPQWILDAVTGVGVVPRGTSEEVEVGDRHAALKDFAAVLYFKGKNVDEIKARLRWFRDTKFVNPEEKTDQELDNIAEYWFKKGIPREEKAQYTELTLKLLSDYCIDPILKLYTTPQATRYFHITDLKKKEVVEVLDPDYRNRVITKEVLRTFGPIIQQAKTVNSAFGFWKTNTEAIKLEPLSVEWPEEFIYPDEPNWCYKRLPFIPVRGEHPTWDGFLSRLSSPEEFQAYIWSIFEEKSKSRQALYLYGRHGEEGKSTVLDMFYKLLGASSAALNNSITGKEARRWLPGLLLGKRLAVWSDCKNAQFTMSEVFRNIVSGDPVTIERKGENGFFANIKVRLMIASNDAPSIKNEGADTSRLIRIDIDRAKTVSADWREKLEVELPQFLYSCMQIYRKLCPDHGDIPLSEKTRELVGDSCGTLDSEFDVFLEKIDFDPKAETAAHELHDLASRLKYSDQKFGALKAHLEKHYGVSKRPLRSHTRKVKWIYRGVFIKSNFEIVEGEKK